METTKQQRYYNSHKESISIQKKQYRKDNIEALQAKAKEKYTCSCGATLTKKKKTQHEQTEKHKQNKLMKPKTIICDSSHDESHKEIISTQTKQQRYYNSHKESISTGKKQYYIDNKEKNTSKEKREIYLLMRCNAHKRKEIIS